MQMIEIFSTSLLLLLFVYLCKKARQRIISSRNRPPGPRGLPLLGNYNLDLSQIHKECSRLAEKYGEVFQLTLFGKTIVVANSYSAITEVLLTKSDDFSGRSSSFRLRYNYKNLSFAFGNLNARNSLLKKFTYKTLKLHGEGIKRIEKVVTEVCEDLVYYFKSKEGKAFDPRMDTYTVICNSISILMFGRKYPRGDKVIEEVKEIDTTGVGLLKIEHALIDLFPFIRYFGSDTFKMMKKYDSIKTKFFLQRLEESRETLDTDAEGKSILGDFIKLQQDPKYADILTDETITYNASTILIGGAHTTSTLLYNALNIFIQHPRVQNRLHEEIDRVIGRDRTPLIEDRKKMPYLEATILELLRYVSLHPLSVPHETTRDTTLSGYDIPKGTQVWVNLWHLQHSEEHFTDPWSFRPERFLDSDGSILPSDHPKRRCVLPFGAGRRVCVGETLAKMRFFILLATIFQRFTLAPDEDNPPPSCDPRTFSMTLTVVCEPYKLKALPRY